MLAASEYYPLLTLLASLTITAGALALMGLRGVSLVLAMLLAFMPVVFVSANFFKFVLPPKIEPYMPDTTLRLH